MYRHWHFFENQKNSSCFHQINISWNFICCMKFHFDFLIFSILIHSIFIVCSLFFDVFDSTRSFFYLKYISDHSAVSWSLNLKEKKKKNWNVKKSIINEKKWWLIWFVWRAWNDRSKWLIKWSFAEMLKWSFAEMLIDCYFWDLSLRLHVLTIWKWSDRNADDWCLFLKKLDQMNVYESRSTVLRWRKKMIKWMWCQTCCIQPWNGQMHADDCFDVRTVAPGFIAIRWQTIDVRIATFNRDEIKCTDDVVWC